MKAYLPRWLAFLLVELGIMVRIDVPTRIAVRHTR